MSEVEQVASGQPVETSGGVQETEVAVPASGQETVKYETYKKTLSEAKRAKAQLGEVQERLNELEQAKLAAEGNKDELIGTLQKQVSELKEESKGKTLNYARTSLRDQIKSQAASLGCVDGDLLADVVDLASIGDVDGETFRADPEQIKLAVDRVRQAKPFLFGKPSPQVNTQVPGGGPVGDYKEDTSKMSAIELADYYEKKYPNAK